MCVCVCCVGDKSTEKRRGAGECEGEKKFLEWGEKGMGMIGNNKALVWAIELSPKIMGPKRK